MKTVAAQISTKYQVVIPKAVREALDLRPGERLLFLLDGDTVILRPEPASGGGPGHEIVDAARRLHRGEG